MREYCRFSPSALETYKELVAKNSLSTRSMDRLANSNSRRRTVLDLGQPAESNWGGVTADLLAERESGEGGEFADRSERTHASLSLATNYSSAQRIAAIKSLTCGKTLL